MGTVKGTALFLPTSSFRRLQPAIHSPHKKTGPQENHGPDMVRARVSHPRHRKRMLRMGRADHSSIHQTSGWKPIQSPYIWVLPTGYLSSALWASRPTGEYQIGTT